MTPAEEKSLSLEYPTRARLGTRERPREQNGPQALIEPAGRPVDCLGLTKRWSLYVASHGNSRVRDEGLRATDAMPASVLTG
jgi:hypothetical protein